MMPLAPSTAGKYLRETDARVQQHAKPLAQEINRWLVRYAREMARRAARDLEAGKSAGKISLTKAIGDSALERELLEILSTHGLRQINETGGRTARALEGDWVIRPSLLDAVLRDKTVKVQRIMRETRSAVRESLRQIIAQAAQEKPRPSVGEIARRIKNQFHGTGLEPGKGGRPEREIEDQHLNILPTKIRRAGEGVLYTFSPERAALIARTESVQTENTAIAEGMAVAGVEEIEWLSRKSSSQWDRRHDLMNGKKVKLGEYFTTPLGNKLRWPGDPTAPIKETAN